MAEDKIVKALEAAKEKLTQLNLDEQLVSEIEWCLGSYSFDGNPSGLYEKGSQALKALEKFKKTNDKKVSKKIVDDLTKALK